MPAPSKNFTVIGDTSIDADSPLTETLMTYFRDNDIHLEEWLGKDYTAAQNHDHDGTNSAIVSSGSSFYFNQPEVSKVSGGSATTYTNVDISANTPGGVAKVAILRITIVNKDDTAPTQQTLYLREDGSGADDLTFTINLDGIAVDNEYSFQCMVPVSGSEIFEYKQSSSSAKFTTTIVLQGYIV